MANKEFIGGVWAFRAKVAITRVSKGGGNIVYGVNIPKVLSDVAKELHESGTEVVVIIIPLAEGRRVQSLEESNEQ